MGHQEGHTIDDALRREEKTQHCARDCAFSRTVECDKHRRGIHLKKFQFTRIATRFIVRRCEIEADAILTQDKS